LSPSNSTLPLFDIGRPRTDPFERVTNMQMSMSLISSAISCVSSGRHVLVVI